MGLSLYDRFKHEREVEDSSPTFVRLSGIKFSRQDFAELMECFPENQGDLIKVIFHGENRGMYSKETK
jgi:hypothetical protein